MVFGPEPCFHRPGPRGGEVPEGTHPIHQGEFRVVPGRSLAGSVKPVTFDREPGLRQSPAGKPDWGVVPGTSSLRRDSVAGTGFEPATSGL